MRAATLVLALHLVSRVYALDVVFLDGRTWSDVRVVSQDATSAIIKHGNSVETVHAAQLSEKSMQELNLRLPTEEELAEREASAKRQAEAAAERAAKLRELEEEQAAYAERVEAQKKVADRRALASPPPAKVVHEFSQPDVRQVGVAHIDGEVLARVPGGAIVRGRGKPSQRLSLDERLEAWIAGTIFIHDNSRLIATTRTTPITGRLVAAGFYRYTDSQGIVHVMAAWRF